LEPQKISGSTLKIIAHRGNLDGPTPDLENSPRHIMHAIDSGFDVEVDVWVIDSKIYFGHDGPVYGPIEESMLEEMSDRLWIHCKNLDALIWFKDNKGKYKYFWHQSDDYTITSNGYFWTFPGMQYSKHSILVSLGPKSPHYTVPHAICTDYPGSYR
jgi:hypothetical protein